MKPFATAIAVLALSLAAIPPASARSLTEA
jgi:hypothetical protein